MHYFLTFFVLGALQVRLFAASMECETYRVEEKQKVDRTIFTLKYTPGKDQVLYRKVAGSDWVIPDGSKLQLIWKSHNGLRLVASWIDPQYENDTKVWHPVFMFDLDFSRSRFSVKTAGGVSDFDEIISDPWRYEARRLD